MKMRNSNISYIVTFKNLVSCVHGYKHMFYQNC